MRSRLGETINYGLQSQTNSTVLAFKWRGVPIAYFALFPLSERLVQANKRQKLNLSIQTLRCENSDILLLL